MVAFVDKLIEVSHKNQSLLCIGLDPDPSLMPNLDVVGFNKTIVDATVDLVCAYKPNVAFYEALGTPGIKALDKTVRYIRQVSNSALVIGDVKRGDISNTARMYARACFEVWGFDAVTVNPYIGGDSLEPFLNYVDRGIFVICRTSNRGAQDLQSLPVIINGKEKFLFEQVAHLAFEWNLSGNVGLVVGATYPTDIRKVREICRDLPILIPGVGTQGGDLKSAVVSGIDVDGRKAIINSTRQITYASREKSNFGAMARQEAIRIRDAINDILEDEGKGW